MFTHAHHNFHRGRWRRRLGRGCEGWALPSLSGRGGERATGSAGQVNRVTDEPCITFNSVRVPVDWTRFIRFLSQTRKPEL